jgi:hypothetical protein
VFYNRYDTPGAAVQAISTTRQTNARLTSRVFAVVFALWLNLAVQPCAMAFDTDHDCPHCPPSHEDPMAAHHGSHGDEARPGCDTQPSDCGEVDDFSLDGRSSLSKLKAKVEAVALVAPSVPEVALNPIGFSTTAADPPGRTAGPPPIHLLNCVFLI